MAQTFDWQMQNLIIGEVFLTYCLFWATDMLSFIKWGHQKKEVFESKNVLAAKADEDEGCLKRWNNYEWKRTWTHAFVLHSISLGLILMYAPYIFAVVISWLHFLICLIIVIFHLLSKDWPKVFAALWTGCRFLNILLIIGGLAGVGSAVVFVPPPTT